MGMGLRVQGWKRPFRVWDFAAGLWGLDFFTAHGGGRGGCRGTWVTPERARERERERETENKKNQNKETDKETARGREPPRKVVSSCTLISGLEPGKRELKDVAKLGGVS